MRPSSGVCAATLNGVQTPWPLSRPVRRPDRGRKRPQQCASGRIGSTTILCKGLAIGFYGYSCIRRYRPVLLEVTVSAPTMPAAATPSGTPTGPPRVTDRVSARAFVERYVTPEADEFDRTERISPDFLANASQAGLWAALVSAEFGGLGLDMLTLGAVHEEIGKGCSSVRNLLTVHHMVSWAIGRWGSPDQRQRWLPAMAAGDVLGAFCVTEP